MAGSDTLESLSIVVRATEGAGHLVLAGAFLGIRFLTRRNISRTLPKFSRVSRVRGRTG